MTASYVVFELNGRTDYSFFASMAEVLYKIFNIVTKDVCDINSDVHLIQVGCRREAQTYQEMIDGNTHLSDFSLAWNPQVIHQKKLLETNFRNESIVHSCQHLSLQQHFFSLSVSIFANTEQSRWQWSPRAQFLSYFFCSFLQVQCK